MVEWDSLENYCGLRSTGGSNPPLPAETRSRKGRVFFYSTERPHLGDGIRIFPFPQQTPKFFKTFRVYFLVVRFVE